MRRQRRGVRILVDDEVSLLADVCEHAIDHRPRRVLLHQPQRDLRSGSRGDHAANFAAFHHVDAEGREIQPFLQRRRRAVGGADAVHLRIAALSSGTSCIICTAAGGNGSTSS